MGELRFQPDLLDEVAHRLDLRAPNRDAVRTVLLRTSDHYDVQEKTEPFECIVDSATGVGKTFVMAGLMEYLAGAEAPARNFLLLAPGRTIRDKSIANFSAGTRKSLRPLLRSNPVVITAENFDSQATRIAMDDPAVTKLYVFTVQALTSQSGEGRATHEALETLGDSFFNRIAGLDDLVILADEHHCYRGKAFSRTIEQLRPELVVGLTATPARNDESLVVYRYPLAGAIADQLVKTPVMVGRRDDRADDETKLRDGVKLLRYKAQHADAYCEEHGLAPVNPVMLVIAASIEEAVEFQTVIDSAAFDNGSWTGKTLLVHSKLPADEKEQALADLEAVEDPDSPVRIIISVGMLKEGWDVKNVYVIASMRASVSEVMTAQTLGRGMRLPFGAYTGVEILDTLEVLAHEKYSELLAKRKVLNEAFINYGIYAEIRQLQDGRTVVRNKAIEADIDVIAPPGGTDPDTPSTAAAPGADRDTPIDAGVRPAAHAGVVDIDTRTEVAAESARKTTAKTAYAPLPERQPITIPLLKAIPQPVTVSLNSIDDYTPFEKLGRALTSDYSDELRRTKITAKHDGRKVEVATETANDAIVSALPLEMPLATTKHRLIRSAMSVKGVVNRPDELGAAERIVDRLIEAMGEKAAEHLSAFLERCEQRLAAKITEALKSSTQSQFTYSDTVKPVLLDAVRETNKRRVDGHADGSFDKNAAFGGWARNLYSHAWFDSSPEFAVANAVDDSPDVIVWARLHVNDVPIKWTSEGREYNPDLVVIEEFQGKRVGWLVEVKADKDMTSTEVVAKRAAAKRWANTANSLKVTDANWCYLLLGEQDIQDAQGLWSQLKEFGQ